MSQEYQETDEALQMSTGLSFRSVRRSRFDLREGLTPVIQTAVIDFRIVPSASRVVAPPSFSTIVHVKDLSHLTLVRPERAVVSLEGTPLQFARNAALTSEAAKDEMLSHVWKTLVGIFESADTTETLFSERVLPEM